MLRRSLAEQCGEREEAVNVATMTFKLDKEQIDKLRQLVSDVNDANLYGLSQLEERIDALERRIEKFERKLNHKGGSE